MRLAISYFYQIRFFKPYMIPVSTCFTDPDWFHNWRSPDYNFIDKRGVINGLRCENFLMQEQNIKCPCENHKTNSCGCSFLQKYSEHLESMNLDDMLRTFSIAAQFIKELLKFNEEPIIVFIVYETPSNPCSERGPLLNYFERHNIDCKELLYPIKDNYS